MTSNNVANLPVPGSPRFQQDTTMAIARLRAALGPEGAPTFSTISLPDLAGAVVRADADGVFQTVTIGSSLSFAAPTLNTVQGIRTADSPTFAGLTLTGFSGVLKATAGVLAGGGAHSDLAGVTANQHHNQAHTLDGADHTVSGLTAGHVLQALSATTFGFAALEAGIGFFDVTFDCGTSDVSLDTDISFDGGYSL